MIYSADVQRHAHRSLRMKWFRSRLLAAALASLTLAAAPQFASAQPAPQVGGAPDSLGADWGAQQDQVRACVRAGQCLSLAQVIAQISRSTPGRSLDAGFEQADGRMAYRVRWAAKDRRIDFIVDAKTGAIIRTEGK
jgi:uncharacterized membrane protein YkoI